MMLALIERNTILVPISFAVDRNIDMNIFVFLKRSLLIYAENNYKIETINRTLRHPMLAGLIKEIVPELYFFHQVLLGTKAALHILDHYD